MRIVIVLVIVLLIGPLWAQQKGGPVGPSTWSVGEGGRLYHRFCTPCHGYYGEGNGYNARFLQKKPADHTDPVAMSKRADAKLFEIVRDGGAKSGLSNEMPPWGKALTDQEIWFLVNYMRFLQQNGRDLAQEHPDLAKVSVVLPGVTPEAAAPAPAPVPASTTTLSPAPTPPPAPASTPAPAPAKAAPATIVEAKPSGPVPVEPRISAAPKPAPAIPGHEDAAQALAAWKGLIAFDPSKAVPGQRGNAAFGRIYYVENCATCHGAEGKGDGPTAVAARMDPMPRNHTDGVYMNAKNDADLHKVVAEGGVSVGKSVWMPDWADKLSDEQIWDLVSYMRAIAVPRYTPRRQ